MLPSPSARNETSSSTTGSPSGRSSSRRSGSTRSSGRTARLRDGPPYALFVGGIQPRKDPLTAIEALALVDGDLRLVLVGRREARRRRGAKRNRATRARAPRRARGLRRARGACIALPRRRLPRLSHPATRASACRCSSRWRPELRSSRARPVRCRRSRAMRPFSSSRVTQRRSPRASGRQSPTATGSSPPGSARAKQFSWAETARLTLAVYRELT